MIKSGTRMDALLEGLDAAGRVAARSVNLTPSETRLSPAASRVIASDFYNRYFFNEQQDPQFWEFRGGQAVGTIETDVGPSLFADMAGTEYVNMRPISGMSAMQTVILGATAPGETMVSIAAESGGHYATAAHAERLGRSSVTISARGGCPDVEELRAAGMERPISLVYVDLQNTLHPIDVAHVSQELETWEHRPVLHVDCSHTLGLVLGGAHPNPLELGADSFGGSTHKTFPGPHKGILFTQTAELRDAYRHTQFDFLSSHHFGETLALVVVAHEFRQYGGQYAEATIRNAQTLGLELEEQGLSVKRHSTARVTDTHQVWVNIGDVARLSDVTDRLARVGINLNSQLSMPGSDGPLLRLGTNETTLEGASDESMKVVAWLVAAATRGEHLPPDANERVRATFDRPMWDKQR